MGSGSSTTGGFGGGTTGRRSDAGVIGCVASMPGKRPYGVPPRMRRRTAFTPVKPVAVSTSCVTRARRSAASSASAKVWSRSMTTTLPTCVMLRTTVVGGT